MGFCPFNYPFSVLFRRSGWAGLLEEVEMDIKRLARRNLGRDDRYIILYAVRDLYRIFS
jgi:hypothetical protein